MNWTVILSFLSVFVTGIKADPNLPAAVREGLGDASGALEAIFAGLQGNGGTAVTPSTILAILAGIVNSLKADPNLPQNVLNQIGVLDRAVAAAFKADGEAKLAVDWNTESHKTMADGPDAGPDTPPVAG